MSREFHPHLQVACAIIERDGLVLAARRSERMSMPRKWEFPGGKIRPGEDPEACLKRELLEEMGIGIAVKRALRPSPHEYPGFSITLHPFVCGISCGSLVLNEHEAVAWLTPEELSSLDWTEADAPVIRAYRRSLDQEPSA